MCATFWVCLTCGSCAVSNKKFLLVSFFVSDITTHTHEHKSNLKLQSKNNTALLVAPIESAQSLLYSLSGKDTTTQTLRLTHRLDLRLIDALGSAITE